MDRNFSLWAVLELIEPEKSLQALKAYCQIVLENESARYARVFNIENEQPPCFWHARATHNARLNEGFALTSSMRARRFTFALGVSKASCQGARTYQREIRQGCLTLGQWGWYAWFVPPFPERWNRMYNLQSSLGGLILLLLLLFGVPGGAHGLHKAQGLANPLPSFKLRWSVELVSFLSDNRPLALQTSHLHSGRTFTVHHGSISLLIRRSWLTDNHSGPCRRRLHLILCSMLLHRMRDRGVIKADRWRVGGQHLGS